MILVVNAGSSSIKIALFDRDLTELAEGAATEVGGDATLRLGDTARHAALPDHKAALSALLDALAAAGHPATALTGAGHRVVHGGDAFTGTVRVTGAVRDAIAACVPLAPLHNPHNLAAIDALAALRPDLPQVAAFDTAFHATIPDVARAYALPHRAETRGIRRYGFHGISYQGLVDQLPALTGAPLPERLLALHLGNGASLCAIRNGRSVATTMGYSPLEGLTMGTRSGDIDPNAVLDLADRLGIDGARTLLNKESGLKGLGGASDMRALRADGGDAARFAIQHFCHAAIRHAGAMIAAMGGCDVLAFTAGIGENDAAVRAAIAEGLAWAGFAIGDRQGAACHAPRSKPIWIVPAEEERTIARAALPLIDGGAP